MIRLCQQEWSVDSYIERDITQMNAQSSVVQKPRQWSTEMWKKSDMIR